MHYDFWGRRVLRKQDFLYDFLMSRMYSKDISFEQASDEALKAWNWINENK